MSTLIVRPTALPAALTWLWLLVAGILAFCDFHFRSPDAGMWGALFALFAGMGFLRHPWGKWWEIDDDGLTTSDGVRSSFADLQVALLPEGVKPNTAGSYPIHAVFTGRVVRIPSRIDVPSADIYEKLQARTPRDSSDELPESLLEYCGRQIDAFGNERVWFSGGRNPVGWVTSADRWKAFGWTLVAAWPTWSMLNIYRIDFEEWPIWFAMSGIACVLGFSVVVLASSARSRSEKRWGANAHRTGIVIAPVGLAVAQGDLFGELPWEEIQRVTPKGRRHIELAVKGAMILLYDVYDRSLEVIHARIMQNWRSPRR